MSTHILESGLMKDVVRARRKAAREALGQRLLASRYWCANGRAVSAVALEVEFTEPDNYFRAYIGAGKGEVEEEDRLWTARFGCKLVESEARAFFPELHEWEYWP